MTETQEGNQTSIVDVEKASRTGASGGAADYSRAAGAPGGAASSTSPSSEGDKAAAKKAALEQHGPTIIPGTIVRYGCAQGGPPDGDVAHVTGLNEDGTVELTVLPAKGNERDVKKSGSAFYFVENCPVSNEPKIDHCWVHRPAEM